MRNSRNSQRAKGHPFGDPLLAYMKGYDTLEGAARNGTELSIEVDSIRHAVFPFREIPADRPGYVTHERNYFEIDHNDPTAKKDLESYFLEKYSRSRPEHLYGHDDSVGGLFEDVVWQLLITGDAYRSVAWGEVEINGTNYTLPTDISFLRSETMMPLRKKRGIVGFRQKFSLYTYLKEKRFAGWEKEKKPRSYKFDRNEIIYFKYPFGDKSPATRSLKLLKRVRKFWQFGIDQARSGVEVESHYLPLERARYTTYAREKRKYDIARSRIRTNFNYMVEANGPKITEYYDLYTVIRYKKFMNDLRQYLVREFNQQIMKTVAVKNGWDCAPKLSYSGFLSNEDLDRALQDYKDNCCSFEQMIERVVSPA